MSEQAINIADIRQDYILAQLDEATAGADPIAFFKQWFLEAEASRITEVNAMTLATVDGLGKPHARTVLLKGLEERGFVFYTNYDSNKGQEMAANAHVSLLFFWKELERQVRIEGVVEKVPAADSDAYFGSRPESSQLGAWASPQSQQITHRSVLELNYATYEKEFSGVKVPRPPHWGGYIVVPERIEFWQGRASRMHDRIVFKRSIETAASWLRFRLAP